MNKALPSELDDIFLGSGALSYPWYGKVDISDTPDSGWVLTFEDSGAEEEPGGEYRITHQKLWATIATLAGTEGKAVLGEDSRTLKECQRLCFNGADDVDFDSDMADRVIQIAAFGEVLYG
ncbi:hypothetical protein [Saccharopolyspora rosea]|uniref:Uncharacterized protein n=1 Tax=Saccharopolyspora rosea TaxID=524884 RepID=A0ABW3FNN5_9PSEU|nr:hypothetical protein [Saccharopolyspora rosea]